MVNDQHNALMGECMKHLDKVTTENAKYKEAYDAFKAAFEEEEKYYKLGTKNPYTESLNKESKYRVFLYNGLRQYLELQISVGFATSASAQKVLDLLDLFKAEMKKNVMGQGAAMRNILTSLAEEEYQTALTETNATFFYTKLGEADKKVEELLVAHRAFNRDWMAEALKKARQRMDEAYDEMANCLNGGAVMFGEPFITAIKDWNSRRIGIRALTRSSFQRSAATRCVRRRTKRRRSPVTQTPISNPSLTATKRLIRMRTRSPDRRVMRRRTRMHPSRITRMIPRKENPVATRPQEITPILEPIRRRREEMAINRNRTIRTRLLPPLSLKSKIKQRSNVFPFGLT